ncbi:MAG: hypothetical protein HY079_01885 [Elusimicrobia bacterium]|nr:hypothetical protein [Elusimicrobiota bacterium]
MRTSSPSRAAQRASRSFSRALALLELGGHRRALGSDRPALLVEQLDAALLVLLDQRGLAGQEVGGAALLAGAGVLLQRAAPVGELRELLGVELLELRRLERDELVLRAHALAVLARRVLQQARGLVLVLALELGAPLVELAQALGVLRLERAAARGPVVAQLGALGVELGVDAGDEALLLVGPALDEAALVVGVARLGLGAALREVGVQLVLAALQDRLDLGRAVGELAGALGELLLHGVVELGARLLGLRPQPLLELRPLRLQLGLALLVALDEVLLLEREGLRERLLAGLDPDVLVAGQLLEGLARLVGLALERRDLGLAVGQLQLARAHRRGDLAVARLAQRLDHVELVAGAVERLLLLAPQRRDLHVALLEVGAQLRPGGLLLGLPLAHRSQVGAQGGDDLLGPPPVVLQARALLGADLQAGLGLPGLHLPVALGALLRPRVRLRLPVGQALVERGQARLQVLAFGGLVLDLALQSGVGVLQVADGGERPADGEPRGVEIVDLAEGLFVPLLHAGEYIGSVLREYVPRSLDEREAMSYNG